MTPTRADICVVACADAFAEDGEILVNPIGNIPTIGGRLAKATTCPAAVLTDGEAMFVDGIHPVGAPIGTDSTEAWNPYRRMFHMLWSGKRHVMMGATQVDQMGNQNIACIGDWEQPRAQLLGFRGAPGNTINHRTSYWVPNHNPKAFVQHVSVVTGIGYDRAAALGTGGRFHDIHRVVSNLCVCDFETPDHRMRLRSLHPGVALDDVVAATGFELVIDQDVATTRLPTDEELAWIERIDPSGLRSAEVPQ
ncbi:MAG: CoA-transferase [Actinobacteria bacterium]|nr:CoA-transferase [Actinomycetota bacterium]MCB9388278.1 CoA-transferase [Acidimicrobiia bacterium]